jgi:hypothetical protein
LQNQLATANKMNRTQRLYGWLWTLVVIGSVTMGATLLGSHPSFFILSTRNSLCAPVRPGTTLFANSAPDQQSPTTATSAAGAKNTLSSPWWAPSSSKSTMYNLLCRHNDAVPIRMDWKGDKIQLLDRDSETVLFQSRASEGVTVHADRIHIGSTSRQRKKGGLVVDAVVAAPWAI